MSSWSRHDDSNDPNYYDDTHDDDDKFHHKCISAKRKWLGLDSGLPAVSDQQFRNQPEQRCSVCVQACPSFCEPGACCSHPLYASDCIYRMLQNR